MLLFSNSLNRHLKPYIIALEFTNNHSYPGSRNSSLDPHGAFTLVASQLLSERSYAPFGNVLRRDASRTTRPVLHRFGPWSVDKHCREFSMLHGRHSI